MRFESLFAEPFRGIIFGGPFRGGPFSESRSGRALFGGGHFREVSGGYFRGERFGGSRFEGAVPGHVAIVLLMEDGESAVGHGGDEDACYCDDVTHICCFSFPTH